MNIIIRFAYFIYSLNCILFLFFSINSAASSSCVVPEDKGKGKGKGKKRSANDAGTSNQLVNDFAIEYAVSGRATCPGCNQKIPKDEIRIKKTVFDTEVGMKFGGQALWHHIDCFAQLRTELGWFASADMLPGYKLLSKEDKEMAKHTIP